MVKGSFLKPPSKDLGIVNENYHSPGDSEVSSSIESTH